VNCVVTPQLIRSPAPALIRTDLTNSPLGEKLSEGRFRSGNFDAPPPWDTILASTGAAATHASSALRHVPCRRPDDACHLRRSCHPDRNDPNSFILGELQSLCDRCHNRDKQRMERQGERQDYDTAVGVDGYPVDERHPCYQRRDG
jgi:hypothetical protein